MLAGLTNPAIMGFELPEQDLGTSSGVCCVRSQEASGPRAEL